MNPTRAKIARDVVAETRRRARLQRLWVTLERAGFTKLLVGGVCERRVGGDAVGHVIAGRGRSDSNVVPTLERLHALLVEAKRDGTPATPRDLVERLRAEREAKAG